MNNSCYNNDRMRLLRMVTQFGFALSDITLFLDTHPRNKEALDYYRHMNHMYKKAKEEYENKYGPLTQFSGGEENVWKWSTQPWPWERGFY